MVTRGTTRRQVKEPDWLDQRFSQADSTRSVSDAVRRMRTEIRGCEKETPGKSGSTLGLQTAAPRALSNA